MRVVLPLLVLGGGRVVNTVTKGNLFPVLSQIRGGLRTLSASLALKSQLSLGQHGVCFGVVYADLLQMPCEGVWASFHRVRF